MNRTNDRSPVRSILIVEDSETCSSTLEVALSSIEGHVVRTAATGEQALAILNAHHTAIVVTDLHLPGLSGFDLIRTIRSTPQYGRPVIVVTSGDADPDTPEFVRTLGADAFFPKPYSPVELRLTLERLIHAKQAIADLCILPDADADGPGPVEADSRPSR
ncbi:MAG: response regulator [Bryobacteraceae bacterium]|nr:response regulator [Bryobacteraceae bacterium]